MFQLLLLVIAPVLAILSQNRVELVRYSAQPCSPQAQERRIGENSHTDRETAVSAADTRRGSSHAQHQYVEKCVEIERKFMRLADSEDSTDSPWTPLTSLTKPYPIAVEGHVTKPFCFRVVFYAPTAPGTAFDLLASILRRPEWDELTESTRIIEKLGPGDAIHYVKMKPVWPTAARDSLLISHLTPVQTRDCQKGYLNVSQSIEDARVPENKAAGIVRMEAGIAGQLITRASQQERSQLGLQGAEWTKIIQIADGDLKGWIPKSVIKFIATQALPRSLTKVCRQLEALPPRAASQLLDRPAADDTTTRGESAPAAIPVPVQRPPPALQRVQEKKPWRAGWLRVLLRFATPAVIAMITSLVFQLVTGRRWRR
ncbi:hypothetical protein GGF46_004404 [Coemansia sp. RSA 552]|nr:hypothetical protein GGF46_004404 [Coemansia sp. RSA 552]